MPPSSARDEDKDRHAAATQIQAVHRGRIARLEAQQQHMAATQIQAIHRGRVARNDFQQKYEAASRIQAVQRGRAVRNTQLPPAPASPGSTPDLADALLLRKK